MYQSVSKQQQQKQAHDLRAHTHSFTISDLVYVCGYGSGQSNWIPAHIVQRTGPVSFKVKLDSGIICCRHQDHGLKQSLKLPPLMSILIWLLLEHFCPFPWPTPNVPAELSFIRNPPFSPQKDHEEEPQEVVHRYPTRERRPLQRLTYHHPNNWTC